MKDLMKVSTHSQVGWVAMRRDTLRDLPDLAWRE